MDDDVSLPSEAGEDLPSMPSLVDSDDDDDTAISLPSLMDDSDDDSDDVAEYYSVPRFVPFANAAGLRGNMSLDKQNGYDFQVAAIQDASFEHLSRRRVKWLMLSPPCTRFSCIQQLWNDKNRDPHQIAEEEEEAISLLKHAMKCATQQVRAGRYFVFEHPYAATSWQQPCVLQVAQLEGVHRVTFDQCRFGLVTKIHKTAVRKRTHFLTNSKEVVRVFDKTYCKRDHEHAVLEGSEGGVKRCKWAERYPDELCAALAQCAVRELS